MNETSTIKIWYWDQVNNAEGSEIWTDISTWAVDPDTKVLELWKRFATHQNEILVAGFPLCHLRKWEIVP